MIFNWKKFKCDSRFTEIIGQCDTYIYERMEQIKVQDFKYPTSFIDPEHSIQMARDVVSNLEMFQ